MDIPEIYWKMTADIYIICRDGVLPGFFLYYFVRPFLDKKRTACLAGIVYAIAILIAYVIPVYMYNFLAFGGSMALAFLMMAVLERKKIRQKVFLSAVFFLLHWTSAGLGTFLCNLLVDEIFYHPIFAGMDMLGQFILFFVETLVRCAIDFLFLWGAVRLVLREYVDKGEEMPWREMILLLMPFFPVTAIMCGLSVLSDVYEADIGNVIWEDYPAYDLVRVAYYLLSFVTVVTTVIVYQKIKRKQEEKRQAEILYGQIAAMKRHIGEVEKLYGDIRILKHDMGNHLLTLERLYERKEYDEAGKYAAALQKEFAGADPGIKSGNPVTDVVLAEKRREAEERGIRFESTFRFPEGTDVNAFDMSVILTNAVANAIEAAGKADDPYIFLSSGRRKNAYMIEVRNSFSGVVKIDEEGGLPGTTKRNKEGHGFGLASIQRVAQKYLGGLDIRQEGGEFVLDVMLILHPGDISGVGGKKSNTPQQATGNELRTSLL